MKTWNNLVDKFDLLLKKIKLESTVKIAGREIPPVVMGFALIVICIPIWGYLEFEGRNKLIGALVAILMAWGVSHVPYTHLTLPTIHSVSNSVVAV